VPQLSASALRTLRAVAARHSTVTHEADDVVQDILLSAISQGRSPADPNFMAWAMGAIRLRTRFVARTAARRARREMAHASSREIARSPQLRLPREFVDALPRSRRVLALLINLGMGRHEIAYLLGLTDVALRQRIAGLKKAIETAGIRPQSVAEGHTDAPIGLARRMLKAALPPRPARQFAVRDPDGVIILISGDHVSGRRGN
jgi:DNA-directed RNA polymerase specialized sigma24 family protein